MGSVVDGVSCSLAMTGMHVAGGLTEFRACTRDLRERMAASARLPEPQAVQRLWAHRTDWESLEPAIETRALELVHALRAAKAHTPSAGLVQALMQEYALSSQEGIALMCMAEAFLRIPDDATRSALVADKLVAADWLRHRGQSDSSFVNAGTWGLILAQRVVTEPAGGWSGMAHRLLLKGGEPLVRQAMTLAMRLLGDQFVLGSRIEVAMERARVREADGFLHSYDMLGEAALTERDAARYTQAYAQAIAAIGPTASITGASISIKLSALHPRYQASQHQRVMDELLPRLLDLCLQAKRHQLVVNIDAEESERLELSMDLLECLAFAPELQGWTGLGFVVQAYQKRALDVIEWLQRLARSSGRHLKVRLVKGAYWDSEIKRTQQEGQCDYPVYTRKVHTDLSYLVCAQRMLANCDRLFPQFATHNAHTVAAVRAWGRHTGVSDTAFEFQCLHGMGETLYRTVVQSAPAGGWGLRCRIYAPVGPHDTLLAYLVRRLLENGANTSFVHRVTDPTIAAAEVVRSPWKAVQEDASLGQALGAPHAAVPLPSRLYGDHRLNSGGWDWSDAGTQARLQAAVSRALQENLYPSVPADTPVGDPAWQLALEQSRDAWFRWRDLPPRERSACLLKAADAMETDALQAFRLLVWEAGKTLPNAVGELRECVDFLRYYAAQLMHDPAMHGRASWGPLVCISPWNFPLAIFVGQVAAALAAGNTVLAKPAEQTPRMAQWAVHHLHTAGVPTAAVQLFFGRGDEVGAALVADARIQGVLFTGSTPVAQAIHRSLAGRMGHNGQPLPLVAETGGFNAMVVDATALPEQVVQDVLASAFDSAGQRCSALRVLCLQDTVADRIMDMLLGAMAELRVGDPCLAQTDVGPVIDVESLGALQRHLDRMSTQGYRVIQPCVAVSPQERLDAGTQGTWLSPALVEVPWTSLPRTEVFGPILHVVRVASGQWDEALEHLRGLGYGLTLGVHSRLDRMVERVAHAVPVGNVYVNRSMVGAVVGVQPFGGHGLSGTGPKAGGPWMLPRLAPSVGSAPVREVWGSVRTLDPGSHALERVLAYHAYRQVLGTVCSRTAAELDEWVAGQPSPSAWLLPGPTGERNVYRWVPRTGVLCHIHPDRSAADLWWMVGAILSTGGKVVLTEPALQKLPESAADAMRRYRVLSAWGGEHARFDFAVLASEGADARIWLQRLALQEGPLVLAEVLAPGGRHLPWQRLVLEHHRSINTTAAGGNAALMTID